jgi:hypothetical protein
VDPSWLDQLSEEERPRSKRSHPAPPPSKRASTPPASKESDETIDVDSAWLIPPVPALPGKVSKPPRPPPPPAVIAVKPRGKLPPPLPRDDGDERPKKR